ncbi:MAG: NHL repeat-containing protein [Meiothermus sp.]|nr:NHL repeat-containing protein [Meiothermus sp.]
MGRRLWALIGLGLLVFLAACSSAPAVGTLQVNITGLPTGVNANVKVTGAGFSQDLTTSTPLSGRAVGSYTVTAASVSSGGLSYIATVTGSPATVTANTTSTVNVAYAVDPASQGTLLVNVNGVPAGASANVSISGPNGFSQTVNASAILRGLVPGAYTITANNIPGAGTTANFTFGGTLTGSPANVTANTDTTATVTYAAITGSLAFGVTGLPAGANPTFTLTDNSGPNLGQKRILTSTATVANLPPIDYNLIGNPVRVSGTILDTVFIAPGDAEFSITAGEQLTLTADPMRYQQQRHSGALWVPNNDGAVQGLSAAQLSGAGGAVTPAGSVTQAGTNQAVVFDRNGRMYVSNSTTNSINIFPIQTISSPAPAPVTITGANTGLNAPIGMAFDSSGRLWVANTATGGAATGDSIVAFSPAQLSAGGNVTPVVTITGPSLFDPFGLAFDFDGNLWVSNSGGANVVRFASGQLETSGAKQAFGTLNSAAFNTPAGLAFNRQGNLWVANFLGNNLLEFTAVQLLEVEGSSRLLVPTTIGGFVRPRGLAFDNGGNLWLTRDSGVLNQISAANLAASGSPAPTTSFTGLGSFRGAGLAFNPTPSNLPIQNK